MTNTPSTPSPTPGALNRRSFLGSLAASTAALGLISPIARGSHRGMARPASPAQPAAPRARNLIFMVADGMSFGTLTLADYVIRRDRSAPSNWVKLHAQPSAVRSLQNTSSLNALVTDSAAAASAWGSGRRVNNASINVLPDGSQLMPLFIRAQQAGKRIGCVSTARITHATPAGFYANSPLRDLENAIAEDLLVRKLTVALGGGARHFSPELLAQHTDVAVVRSSAELAAAPQAGRLLGVFSPSHIPFVLDRDPTTPGLVDMTAAALARLDTHPEGFALQIEAGRVDHAAHNNDAASLVAEQIEFDEAIGAVLRWMNGRDDTLLIVTTDHGNANPGLTAYDARGAEGMARLAKVRRSFDWLYDQIKPLESPDERAVLLRSLVEQHFEVPFTPEDAEMVVATLEKRPRRINPFKTANTFSSVLGEILADPFGVAFVSPNHTADLVELTAVGPGSQSIPPYVDNNALHDIVVRALALPEAKRLEGMDVPLRTGRQPKPD